MSFSIYAVRVIDGIKHRHFISSTANIDEARHIANCCTCGNADYAYVKEIGGGTVFFIRHVEYQNQPCPINPRLKGLIEHLPEGSYPLYGSDQRPQLEISLGY